MPTVPPRLRCIARLDRWLRRQEGRDCSRPGDQRCQWRQQYPQESDCRRHRRWQSAQKVIDSSPPGAVNSHCARFALPSRQSRVPSQNIGPDFRTNPRHRVMFLRMIKAGTSTALSCSMMTIFFIALTLTAACLITELIAATYAPFGFQDEAGFHFGNERSGNPTGLENPS